MSSVEAPSPYRTAQSPSLDLALPEDAPGVPPAVLEASQALRARFALCQRRAGEQAEAQAAVEAAIAEDRHNALQAAERGEAETGNAAEQRALEQLAGAERASEAAANSWKWACRELAAQIHAHRDEWFEKLDAEIEKARDRLLAQLDKLQAGFDRLEALRMLKDGLAEIPPPGGHVSGIRLNATADGAYRQAERQRTRDYTLTHGPGSMTSTDVVSLLDALAWRATREGSTEPGRASW